jgi:hypothetical protein
MTWRLARALETLRAQVNAKWPSRIFWRDIVCPVHGRTPCTYSSNRH